jgi:hypothetical protein
LNIDRDAYCREIEAYLCRKNDGHLIRVVGPSFDLVSGWAARGIPLKIVFEGVDRVFERYHRTRPRRRPLKIDFCEADVLDVFDEWRRALGLTGVPTNARGSEEPVRERRRSSLPAHLERAVLRLTSARARGLLGASFDEVIDRIAGELDVARGHAGGLRGEARDALLSRLAALDADLLAAARDALDDATQALVAREADEELVEFRTRLAPDAFARARALSIDRLVRERFGLPVIVFTAC